MKNMLAERLKEMISKNYEIGELQKYKKLDRGYVNTSYEIETVKNKKKNKYFLRKYKEGIKEDEVKFEHSLINHLMKKDFTLAAGIIYAKDGRTYIKRFENEYDEDTGQDVFYAVFDFLPGEDRYTWDNPACTNEELKRAAAVLAQYHKAVFDLNPDGKRSEPRIIDLLPHIAHNLRNCAKKARKTRFDAYFLENLDAILASIDYTLDSIDKKEYEALVHLAIHCDYHPGNLKFQDRKITGLFDFDWSKIDARCFDVALAITYFCSAWEGKKKGDLELDKTAVFLRAYQGALQGTQGVGPLNDIECKSLPQMIRESNIYVLHWGVKDFYTKEVNPDEYLRYLRHSILLMKWLEDKNNVGQLEKTIRESIQAGVKSTKILEEKDA